MAGQSWFDLNSQRSYPFSDSADMLGLPNDVIVDLSVTVPTSAGIATPVLQSISVGPAYASFVLSVNGTPVGWYTGSNIPDVVLPMEGIDGFSGTVVFGNGVKTWRGRVDGLAAALVENTYVFYTTPELPYLQINHLTGVALLDGIIELVAGDNVLIEPVIGEVIDGVTVEQGVKISLDANNTTLMQRLATNCGRNVSAGSCEPAAIATIAGVRPDCDGNITIRFINAADVTLTPGTAADGVLPVAIGLGALRACASSTGEFVPRDSSGAEIIPVEFCTDPPYVRPAE